MPREKGRPHGPALALDDDLADHPAVLELAPDSLLRARRAEARLAEE
jgi:hypothetical protein